MPLQEARKRFLDKLAEECPILRRLLGSPLIVWMSLSDAAKDLCRSHGWVEIQYSPSWTELSPAAARNAKLRKEKRLHIEIIPLREPVSEWASKFGLLYNGKPANWAMDTVVETLYQAGRRTKKKRTAQWEHPIEFSQEYPALTDQGWVNASTGLPEEELFTIVIEIPPKQPNESFKVFEKRFNKTCRKVREEYVQALKAKEWVTRPPYRDFTLLDRLAQWQAGRSASEIDPSIKTPSDRAAFSRSIKRMADYIKITPRVSKHDPKSRSKH